MKIKINPKALDALAMSIARSVPTLLSTAIEDYNETELLREIRNSSLSKREKLLDYLARTDTHRTRYRDVDEIRITSEELRKKFSFYPNEMKAVRDALVADKIIEVPETAQGTHEIVYRRDVNAGKSEVKVPVPGVVVNDPEVKGSEPTLGAAEPSAPAPTQPGAASK